MGLFNKLFQSTPKKKSIAFIGHTIDSSDPYYYDGLLKDDKLINEGHASNTDVYSVQKKLCQVSSDVPKMVEEWNGEEWVINEDSALNEFLLNPSEDTNGFDWWYQSMLSLLNTGDLFYRQNVAAFDLVTELRLLEPNLTDICLSDKYDVKSYQYNEFWRTVNYSPEEVLHLKYYNPTKDGLLNKRGLSPLQAAYNSLKASNNRLTAQAHLYENRGATNIISSGSDIVLTPDERDDLQKNTDKILGGAKNFNKSIVTTGNVNVTPLGMSAEDLKLIEAKDLDLRDICNAFNVPSTLFNDQAASTLDNLKVGTKLMYTDAVIPNNNKILDFLNYNIVPAYSNYENKQLRISQNLSSIDALQEDQLTKVQKQQTEVNTILSIVDNQNLSEEQKSSLLNHLGYEL